MGVMDLIRESGFDVHGIADKRPSAQSKNAPLSVRPRSHSTTKTLPPLSDKLALRLAINYKRQVIEKNRRENAAEEPAVEQVAPKPI